MRPLEVLEAELGELGDAAADARCVVEALACELRGRRPAFLTRAEGEWDDPYLSLSFGHRDGTVLRVSAGDGYTRVAGADIDFRGYLEPRDLADVLVGVLRGQTTYVRRSRFGLEAWVCFEVAGRDGECLGKGFGGIAELVPSLVGRLPLGRASMRRTRLSFEAIAFAVESHSES